MAQCQQCKYTRNQTARPPWVASFDDLSPVGKRAFQRLPLLQRLVLDYHHHEGRNFVEIADLLGCDPETVEQLYHDAGKSTYRAISHSRQPFYVRGHDRGTVAYRRIVESAN